MRPNGRAAYVATVVYFVAGSGWALLTAQPGPAWLEIAWFATVGAVGSRLPGLANQVSLARAYLAAPALVYALHHDFGALALVVAVAGLSDLLDGTVARRFGQPSQLGGGLDPVVDGIFMAALVFGLAAGGTLPWWLAAVAVARYALPALGGAALLALGKRPELRHTLTGQISTVLILVLVGGVCLLRGLGQDASGWLAGAEVVIPVATLATFVHLAFVARRPAGQAEPG